MTYEPGVKLDKNDPVDETRLIRHGVISQSLVKFHLKVKYHTPYIVWSAT